MKMPLFRNVNPYKRRNALLSSGGVLIGAALALLILLIFVLQFFAPGFLVRVSTPVWQAGTALSDALQVGTGSFGNASELLRERDVLANENLALHEENRTLAAKENDMETLIGTTPSPERRILAGVLARPPVAPYDTLVVAAGTKEGVNVGVVAYGPGGVPLGTVTRASTDSSSVSLYSTAGRVTEGWVGDTHIPITLTGRGGGAFEATLPRGSGVLEHAVVYVPGPGALALGTIVRIDSNPSSPRDTVFIAPYANLFALTWIELSTHL